MSKFIIIIVTILLATDLQSHSGRTNSEGCHNNRKTGDYHCHNSKPKLELNTNTASKPTKYNNSQSFSDKPTNSKFKCSGKRVCREMISCAEAKFYLKECKVNSLDGDSDGIPCENICR